MPRHPTPPLDALPIPHDSWLKLFSGRLEDINNPKELWEVAVEAIDEWTRRHHPNGFTQVTHVGYQWKHLFLPPGTLLRTIFRGKNYHCLVEAEHLLYEGKPVSPNVFVNAVGGIRRNAWRSIWVLYPNTTDWKLADTLRTRTRSRPTRARKLIETPVQAAAVATPPDVTTSTLPAKLSQAAPQPHQVAPQPRSVAPQPFHDAGAAAPQAADLEVQAAVESALPSGPPASTTEVSSVDSALARLLLAELLAIVQRLRASAQPAERAANIVERCSTYSFNAGNYATPHMRMALRQPAAREAAG
jgi:hypothetical protein